MLIVGRRQFTSKLVLTSTIQNSILPGQLHTIRMCSQAFSTGIKTEPHTIASPCNSLSAQILNTAILTVKLPQVKASILSVEAMISRLIKPLPQQTSTSTLELGQAMASQPGKLLLLRSNATQRLYLLFSQPSCLNSLGRQPSVSLPRQQMLNSNITPQVMTCLELSMIPVPQINVVLPQFGCIRRTLTII